MNDYELVSNSAKDYDFEILIFPTRLVLIDKMRNIKHHIKKTTKQKPFTLQSEKAILYTVNKHLYYYDKAQKHSVGKI